MWAVGMRTHGTLKLVDGFWQLRCEPHVAMMAKRVFPRIPKGQHGTFHLSNTPDVCRDLEWFSQRYPLAIEHAGELAASAEAHRQHIAALDQILTGQHQPRAFSLALPLRGYQAAACELYLRQKALLVGDEVGLGKTAVAIGSFCDPATLPAAVVTLAHLPGQWVREIATFAPGLKTHVLKKTTLYDLGTPDVVLLNYHKLAAWAQALGEYCKSVVYDEVQELRKSNSGKAQAARHLSESVPYRLGLSATPIYNYGGEIRNVVNVLSPGALGTSDEFYCEWCEGSGDKARLRNPEAFGSWLRENHLMLRRTRADVGRELPAVQRITQRVDTDTRVLDEVADAASELAKIVLTSGGQPFAKLRAAEELSSLLRQSTGIAKAPYVAAFVRLLVESGESVVLFGWHRAVYQIWLERLADYNPVLYTGSETPSQKAKNVAEFIEGRSRVIIISLRAGAGLNGLQTRSSIAVIGELDWSPGVHEQNIGRLQRDGQKAGVLAYFLLAEDGSDPAMAEVLGLKTEQIEGIIGAEPDDQVRDHVLAGSTASIQQLAADYLARRGIAVEVNQ